jgi:transposase
MALIQIEIVESPALLAQLIEQEQNLQHFQRLRMLYLLKTEKLKTLRHIAQILGRHRSTLQLWVKHYRQGGLSALLKNKNDRFVDIPAVVIERLIEQFQDAQFLPRIAEIQSWLQQELSVTISYDRLNSLLSHKVVPLLKAQHQQVGSLTQPLDLEGLAWLEGHAEVYNQWIDWQAERAFPIIHRL